MYYLKPIFNYRSMQAWLLLRPLIIISEQVDSHKVQIKDPTKGLNYQRTEMKKDHFRFSTIPIKVKENKIDGEEFNTITFSGLRLLINAFNFYIC